jgi:transcriptional regulator with XRE-family HTH domain
MKIFERVVTARHFANLTQEELAKKINISRRSLQILENDQSDPKISIIIKIAEECNINPCWLLTGLGLMIDNNNPFIHTDNSTLTLFIEATQLTANKGEIDEILRVFILRKQLAKIKEFVRNEGILNKLILNHHENLKFLRILTRALSDSRDSFKNDKLTIDNAKELLKKIIINYELRLIKDILDNVITTKTKQNLVNWIDTELDDLSCFIFLSDFDITIRAIKESLNKVDQLTVNLS